MKPVSIVDIGKELQKYGLRVGENPAFGRVGKHAENSYHYGGKAIDVTDWRPDVSAEYEGGKAISWQERTRRLAERAKKSGLFTEALGPGDPGHSEHVHLALKDTVTANPQLLEWVATGRYKAPGDTYAFDMPTLQAQQITAQPDQSQLLAEALKLQKQREADEFLTDFVSRVSQQKTEYPQIASINPTAMLQQAFEAPKLLS